MHSGYGSMVEIFYAFLVGFIIGYMFYKTRSLPLVTMVHGFINVFLFGVIPHLF
jgi:membrane protease YdiL (CAAX protease family)